LSLTVSNTTHSRHNRPTGSPRPHAPDGTSDVSAATWTEADGCTPDDANSFGSGETHANTNAIFDVPSAGSGYAYPWKPAAVAVDKTNPTAGSVTPGARNWLSGTPDSASRSTALPAAGDAIPVAALAAGSGIGEASAGQSPSIAIAVPSSLALPAPSRNIGGGTAIDTPQTPVAGTGDSVVTACSAPAGAIATIATPHAAVGTAPAATGIVLPEYVHQSAAAAVYDSGALLAPQLAGYVYGTTGGAEGSNVQQAWHYANGAGVVVGVVDDGFNDPAQYTNFSASLAKNFGPGSLFGYGVGHGQQTSAEIGTAATVAGPTGVSPNATMLDASISYGDPNTNDFVNAVVYAAANADVVSCSWTTGSGALFLPVIQAAVSNGRHGLGTSLVFAAGNGGYDVALETIQDDYQVTSVAMTDAYGNIEPYSYHGAGLLTSAAGATEEVLTTTGGKATLNTGGGGTSNAAPIIAGIDALMYQVNPGLGWRDVQEIIADSSYATPQAASTFVTNGASGWNGGGMEFSDIEGFGVLDANVAVNLARAWTLVSTSANQVTGTVSSTQTLTGAIGQGTLAFSQGIRVQHVQVAMGSSSWIQSGASLILVSPDGTRSVLLDGTTSLCGSSPIDSNAFWGENAKGNWTLIEQGPSGSATVSGWTLTVEGDSGTVATPLVYTPEFATVATAGTRAVVSNAGNPSNTTIDLIALPGATSINLNGGAGTIDGVAVTVQAGLLNANADGSLGDVTLIGTAGSNTLTGGDGNTVINGGGGNDTITAGYGSTTVTTGTGASTVSFAANVSGASSSLASSGTDTVIAGAGNLAITEAPGASDTITAGSGQFSVALSGTASATMAGAASNLTLTGNAVIAGGSGSAAVTVASGTLGTVSGCGIINGAFATTGNITAGGGTLVLGGNVSCGGILGMSAGGTLDIDGVDTAGGISFSGGGETLLFGAGAGIGATVSGWQANDEIGFDNQAVSSAIYSGGILTISGASGAAGQVAMTGNFTQGNFVIQNGRVAEYVDTAPPVVAHKTGGVTWAAGQTLSLTLAANTFSDPNGLGLTYAATAGGGALPGWLGFNTATDTFSGVVPNSPVPLSITVTATDTAGLSASETFQAGLPPAPPTVVQTAAQIWKAGNAFSLALPGAFTDPQGQALTYTAVQPNGQAIPTWIGFNTQTGTFSGNAPTAVQTLALKVTATDTSGLSVSETIQASVSASAPVLAQQTANQAWTAGKAFTTAIPVGAFTDPQGEALTYTAALSTGAALPAWLAFSAATGTFSGTAPIGVQSLAVKITASDASGLSASETFQAAVTASAPVLAQQTANQAWTANQAFSLAIPSGAFTDPQGEKLTYTAALSTGALPAWLTFSAATGTFSGTAPVAQQSLSIKVTATDTSGVTAYETFQSAVSATAPVLAQQTAAQAWTANQPFTLAIPSGTFTDPQNEALTYTATVGTGQALLFNKANNTFGGTATAIADPQKEALSYTATLASGQPLPTWITFNGATGTFTGTAPTALQTLSLTVKATDTSGMSSSETFQVAVSASAPTVTAQTAAQTWSVGKAFSLAIPANAFTDPQGEKLTYAAAMSSGAMPTWLTFNAATDTFSGTPQFSQTAISGVVLTATDASGLSVSETFAATVAPSAPVLAHQTAAQSWGANQAFSLPLPANAFTDPQGETLSYTATTSTGALPAWLSINQTTGTFSGTAPTGVQALTLKLTATDTSGMATTETFKASVTAAAPVLAHQTAAQSWTAGKAFNLALPANAFTDPQGESLTYTALSGGSALPSWLTFNAATETFSGTAPTALQTL